MLLMTLFGRIQIANAEINLHVIKRIESNGNPKAYNKRTKATGLYQITPICLKHYNSVHRDKFTMEQLFDPKSNRTVASWYLSWLQSKFKTDTEVLVAYNYGYSNAKKWNGNLHTLPIETYTYITKYYYLNNRIR